MIDELIRGIDDEFTCGELRGFEVLGMMEIVPTGSDLLLLHRSNPLLPLCSLLEELMHTASAVALHFLCAPITSESTFIALLSSRKLLSVLLKVSLEI